MSKPPERKGYRPQAIRHLPSGRVTVLQWERIEKARPEERAPAQGELL